MKLLEVKKLQEKIDGFKQIGGCYMFRSGKYLIGLVISDKYFMALRELKDYLDNINFTNLKEGEKLFFSSASANYDFDLKCVGVYKNYYISLITNDLVVI